MSVVIEGQKYVLKYDPKDHFAAVGLKIAYCHQLAKDFMPIILDPRGQGSKPYPPEFVAYRLIIDPKKQRLCILFEIYWKRQECRYYKLNKNHDHDYEQIQIHFDMKNGKKEMIVVSSVGPIEYGGHGVEVYFHTDRPKKRIAQYTTSPKEHFPWGGSNGRNRYTQLIEMPIESLVFKNGRPVLLIVNCYHAFTGKKIWLPTTEGMELTLRLKKLDRDLLQKWYLRHIKNRFGHDISQPFNEPYVMYYPPPEDGRSRVVYNLLWIFNRLKDFFV